MKNLNPLNKNRLEWIAGSEYAFSALMASVTHQFTSPAIRDFIVTNNSRR